MGKPTNILLDEHKNILKVINALLAECADLELSGKINSVFFRQAIDFIRNYADKFHHAKEEDILFVELNKNHKRLPCNPIEQMLHEHTLGRQLVKGLEDGLGKNNKEDIIKNARGYADLLKEHIMKEDNILYPMADEALGAKIQSEILKKFKIVEKKYDSKLLKKYHSFARKL